jgi:hypothetical protein
MRAPTHCNCVGPTASALTGLAKNQHPVGVDGFEVVVDATVWWGHMPRHCDWKAEPSALQRAIVVEDKLDVHLTASEFGPGVKPANIRIAAVLVDGGLGRDNSRCSC